MIESFVKLIALQAALTAGVDKADKWFEKREAKKIEKDQEDALEMNRLFDWLQGASGDKSSPSQKAETYPAITSVSTILDNVTLDKDESSPMTGFSNEMFEGNITFTDVITHQKIDELGEFNYLMSSITHEKMDDIIGLLEGDEKRDKRARREKNEARRDNMFGKKTKVGLGAASMLGGGGAGAFFTKALAAIMSPLVLGIGGITATILTIKSMLNPKAPVIDPGDATAVGKTADDAKARARNEQRAKAADARAKKIAADLEKAKKIEAQKQTKILKQNAAANSKLFKLNAVAREAAEVVAAANKLAELKKLKDIKANAFADSKLYKLNEIAKVKEAEAVAKAAKAAKLLKMNQADAARMLAKADDAKKAAALAAQAVADANKLAELKKLKDIASNKVANEKLFKLNEIAKKANEAERAAKALIDANKVKELHRAALQAAEIKRLAVAARLADEAAQAIKDANKAKEVAQAVVDANKLAELKLASAGGDAASSVGKTSKLMRVAKISKTVVGKALLPVEAAFEIGANMRDGQDATEATINGVGDMVRGLGWVVLGALDYTVEGAGWVAGKATGEEKDWSLVKDTDEEGGIVMKALAGETNVFNHVDNKDKVSSIGTSKERGKILEKEAENKFGAVDIGWGTGDIEDLEKLAALSIEHLDALLFMNSWDKDDEETIKKILMSKQDGKEVEYDSGNWLGFGKKLIFNEEITKQYDADQLKIKEDKEAVKAAKRAEVIKIRNGIKVKRQGVDWGMDDTLDETDAGRASSDFVIQGAINQAIQYQQGSQVADLNQLTSNAVANGQAGSAVYVDNTTNNNTTNQGDHIVTGTTAHAPNLPAGNNGSIMSNRFNA